MLKNLYSPLIETAELAKLIKGPPKELTVVNANFGFSYQTHVIRPAEEWLDTFKKERVPRARHVNISLIGDRSENLPNMLPTPDNFVKVMKDLDIGKKDHVICYGDENIVGACRAWWMFKVFGFPNVQIMNGTFAKWKKEENKIETGNESWKTHIRHREPEDFQFELNKALLTKMGDLLNLIKTNKMNTISLVDARSEGRFAGDAPDPKGLKVGHIPGAKNIHFTDFLNNDDTFKSLDEIKGIIKSRGIELDKHVTATCGSGMTASVIYMGMYLAGANDMSLYDGSWSEWAKHPENPVEKGPAL